MPELPEVQTVANELNGCALNQPITDVDVARPQMVKNADPREFARFLVGERFVRVDRIGKYLLFRLTNDKTMVSHLRMEGKYYYEPAAAPYDHRHVLVRISMGANELRYHDTRRFGTFGVYRGDAWKREPGIAKLALDPLDAAFSGAYLREGTRRTGRAIKSVLLDQTVVSGIGNIYADEILFSCRLHPEKPADKITKKKADQIAAEAKRILLWAIKLNGTTIASYKFKKGHAGSFQEQLQVHTRANKPCRACGAAIKKIKVGGRGTYFCPRCQKG